VKCSSQHCPALHSLGGLGYCWSSCYPGLDTIWDWLEDINAEGGAGYAGHNDWRIPNIRELQSIVDYGKQGPVIDPIFGPTDAAFYWSSTTDAGSSLNAWGVDFLDGRTFAPDKGARYVRAVRGGPQ
jgi:Protein of unknown function (DUF1566)